MRTGRVLDKAYIVGNENPWTKHVTNYYKNMWKTLGNHRKVVYNCFFMIFYIFKLASNQFPLHSGFSFLPLLLYLQGNYFILIIQ